MLFNSYEFLLYFFPLTLAAYLACRATGRLRVGVGVLAVASVFFYGWWDWRNLPILGASVVFNFLVGRRIAAGGPNARAWLTFGVVVNLLALGFFKYWNFFAFNVTATTGFAVRVLEIALPLGISFFTFTQIAFLVDTWRGKAREYRFLEYVLFVSYFPHLIAGPIIHHKQLIPQLSRRLGAGKLADDFALGLLVFTLGLAKKVLVADNIAPHANLVFEAAAAGRPIDAVSAWAGVLAYTLQLYFDFSGYSDMAVGLSKMLGINLPINFNAPYRSTSIVEFWRRWHMTLSRFLRDYLYIPLGGNRQGPVRRYVNLLVTMVLGGFWHGAGWTFIIWGAIHGGALALNHLWRSIAPPAWTRAPLPIRAVIGWGLTFAVAMLGWVYFRSHDVASAHRLLAAMASLSLSSLSGLAQALRHGRDVLLAIGPIDAFFAVVGPSAGIFLPPHGHMLPLSSFFVLPVLLLVSIAGPTALVLACRARSAAMSPSPLRRAGGIAVVAATGVLLFLCLGRINNATEFLYFQF